MSNREFSEQKIRDTKGDFTRKHIKASIAKLAAKRHISDITLADICSAADLTSGAIYFHFSNKEEAIEEMVIDEVEAHYARVLAGSESRFADFLGRIIAEFSHYFRESQYLPRAVYVTIGTRRRVGKAWLDARQPVVDRLTSMIGQERARCGLPEQDASFLAHYVLNAIEDLSMDAFQWHNTNLASYAGELAEWQQHHIALWTWAIRAPFAPND